MNYYERSRKSSVNSDRYCRYFDNDFLRMKKYIILIGLILCFMFLANFYRNQSRKYKSLLNDKELILASKERLYRNDSLQFVSSVKVWSLKIDELKRANQKALSEKSEYEKLLSKAYQAIKLSEAKEKNIKAYYESLLSSKDTIYLPMTADCILPPIKTKHINIDFIYKDTLVGVAYDYHTGQNIVVTLTPKRKSNGKKHFPNWGNLPWVGWEKNSIWTVEDKNANITNQIAIEFKK